MVFIFQGANLQLITGFLPDLFCTFAIKVIIPDMALIKSISGIRGTIGGLPGESLTPVDIVKFASAYATWLGRRGQGARTVVTGRDARVSGEMVAMLVNAALRSVGMDVIDAGMVTTPTVEIAVKAMKAGGGIIFTASHNPAQWNALKLLNEEGEFLSDADGREVLALAEAGDFDYVSYEKLGKQSADPGWTEKHIRAVADMPLVNRESIRKAHFKVVVDAVNSVGGVVIPELLRVLGVAEVTELYCDPDGLFPHNPEPLPEHLGEIARMVKEQGADLGFVVDPDVDRLAIVCEDGTMFGEEYTLVSVADYVLSHIKGSTVSNMSSTKALMDVTGSHGCSYTSAPVGEVNVVAEMKLTGAVIGGEGNGGVIYPALHYGRDALAGIALFLTHLSEKKLTCSELRRQYPDYFIAKKKTELTGPVNMDSLCDILAGRYPEAKCDTRDGIRLDLPSGWVQIRKSNTEPIMRIYAEDRKQELAEKLAEEVMAIVKNL
jgi:phosphomannomutase